MKAILVSGNAFDLLNKAMDILLLCLIYNFI